MATLYIPLWDIVLNFLGGFLIGIFFRIIVSIFSEEELNEKIYRFVLSINKFLLFILVLFLTSTLLNPEESIKMFGYELFIRIFHFSFDLLYIIFGFYLVIYTFYYFSDEFYYKFILKYLILDNIKFILIYATILIGISFTFIYFLSSNYQFFNRIFFHGIGFFIQNKTKIVLSIILAEVFLICFFIILMIITSIIEKWLKKNSESQIDTEIGKSSIIEEEELKDTTPKVNIYTQVKNIEKIKEKLLEINPESQIDTKKIIEKWLKRHGNY